MRATLLAIFVVLPASCLASDEAWLADFTKKNAGKFMSELSGLPRLATVRIKPFSGWWRFAQYDQQAGALTADLAGNVWSEWVYERCKPNGNFTGVNAFGSKVNVQRQTCERLEIQDPDIDGISLRHLTLAMSPQQFRDFKSLGPIYEIEMNVGVGVKQEVASDDTIIASAKIDSPVEKRIRVLRVNGEFQTLRIYAPNGKTLLGQVKR